MFTKILVLTVTVAIASCSDRHYLKRAQHESLKEYRHPYEHGIQVQEPSSEEYKPEHSHAFSSQSVVHHGQTAGYEESHESTDHVAPVYQYKVNEQSEETPVHHDVSAQHKYRPAYEHEIPIVRVPAHQKTAYYHPESHEAHSVPAYQPQSHDAHKVPAYHSESQEAHKAYYQSESNEAHQKGQYQPDSHEVHQKVQYQPESHEVHQKVQYQPEPAYHHAVTEHHAVHADSHESHDEPIDYYAYPKYQYEYKVEDPHTGDNKFQHEIRDGDVVKGVYGLHEADGSIRTVEYSSDKHHGFTAVVKHSAPGHHVHIESHHQNEHQN